MSGYIFSKTKPIIYLNMPKSGCSTIKNCLYYLDNNKWLENPLDIHKNYSKGLKSAFNMTHIRDVHEHFSFTFVRHPLKRNYSLFQEKILQKTPYSFSDKIFNTLINKYGINLSTENSLDLEQENYYKFLCFVYDTIHVDASMAPDPHWRPQYDILNQERYRGIDFVGKLENFGQDFRFVLDKIGVTEPLENKRFNENAKKDFNYTQVLTPKIIELGNEIYKKDFEYFGYQKVKI